MKSYISICLVTWKGRSQCETQKQSVNRDLLVWCKNKLKVKILKQKHRKTYIFADVLICSN